MKKQRLFFVGIPTRYVKPTIERAQSHGFEVILGDTEENLRAKAALIAGADQQVVTDLTNYEDLAAVAQRLHTEAPLDAMCTFKEPGGDVVARVVQELHLQRNSPAAVEACINKFTTHRLLRQAHLATPRSLLCQTVADAQQFWESTGGPIVMKPHNMQASIGVQKIRERAELESAFAACLQSGSGAQVLVEEMLVGREISLEATVLRGRATLFGVTAKHLYPGTVIECGHTTPDPHSELTRQEYQDLIQRVIEALGITHGPLHIEGFHTERGFVLTDIHTRYGGDFIVTFTELAMKCDMTTPVFADLVDMPYEITFGQPQEVAGVRFLEVKPGIIQTIEGLEEVRQLAGVHLVELDHLPGDIIKPLNSSFDRAGCIVASAATHAELEKIFAQALQLLQIVTLP